jgi:hypothetical protein
LLADAGYLSARNLTIDGPGRLIATAKTRDLEHAARDRTGPAGVPRHGEAITTRNLTTTALAALPAGRVGLRWPHAPSCPGDRRRLARYSRALTRAPHTDIEHHAPVWLRL